MMLGCLLDAGWPVEELRAVLERLRLAAGSWSVRGEPVMRGPLRATLAVVHRARRPRPEPPHDHKHDHPHDHGHSHSHDHHDHHAAAHGHRNLGDIRAIVAAADLPPA